MIRTRSTRLTQPQGLAEVDNRFGLVPAGLFVGSSGRIDAASGTPFSVGSAAAFGPGRLGVGAIQAAVNTGLYRPMPEVASATAYTAIWHGDVLGAPAGTAPEFLGIVNSATSQGAGVIGINRLTTTTLGVFARSGSAAVSRSGAYTWGDAYGKTVTMVAVVNLAAGTVTLDICVGGVMRRVIDSTFTGGSGPTLTGTHQFVVGPDVIEIPTRHINSNVALAGAFYGAASDAGIKELLANPWVIFRPGERRVWALASAGGGSVAGNATGSLSGLSLSPAGASSSGAAQASAALAPLHIAPTQATASGGASIPGNASASLAALSLTSAQAAANGAAQASAVMVALQIAPASATASGGASVPSNASAALASLSTTPATASAIGAAIAAGPLVGMNLTPAQAQAAGAAWAAAQLRALTVIPATATAGDGSGPGIDWAVTGARAIVPLANTRAIVAHFDAVAIVPAANTRAIVPASGDDMDPIKTVEQYRQDREVYEIDFGAKYLTQANDTAATLKAVGSDAGITVTPQVAVGGALSSGVVKVAVDDPVAAGEYKVWAQIATTAGRERTGVIVVRVDDL